MSEPASSERYNRLESLYQQALDLPDEERRTFLARECRGDAGLLREIDDLLDHYRAAQNGFLSGAAHALSASAAALAPLPEQIGPYRVVSLLGRGGMGVVYAAEQLRPRRRVALKVLRSDALSEEALARLGHEADALGRLRHPAVAAVYEFGVGDVRFNGVCTHRQPYFAMELVPGVPLSEFAAPGRTARERLLELFAVVCDAVQHAHQHGVIHRDLKPANILVSDDGQPKVLDFGVARLARTDGQASGTLAWTGSVLGTLAYMSPEQAAGDRHAVDTRSDVYALGVILYELLARRLPIECRDRPIPDAVRAICDTAPTPLGAVDAGLRGDLETIVAKALEKDPARRYQSAGELAADIRRQLHGEPIEARRDSRLYLLSRRLSRYRGAIAVGLVLLAAVAAFAFYATLQADRLGRLAQRERLAREESEDARTAAQRAERSAVADRQAAERATDRAESVTDFMLEMLAMADPDVTEMRDMRVRDMLDYAREQAASAFRHQPEAEARVRTAIGRAFAALGELSEAEQELGRALRIHDERGSRDLKALHAILWPYAHVLDQLSDPSARANWRRLRPLPAEILAQTAPALADVLRRVSAPPGAVEDGRPPAPQLPEVLDLARETLAADDPRWLLVADHLYLGGHALRAGSRSGEACGFLQAALELHRARLGETHSRVLQTLSALSDALSQAGRHREAEAVTREWIELLKSVLPEDHWSVAECEGRLGGALLRQGRHEPALAHCKRSLERVVAAYGWTHQSVPSTLSHLCEIYDALGRSLEARETRRALAGALARVHAHASLALREQATAHDHRDFWAAATSLREALHAGSPRVPALLDEVLPARRERFPDGDEFAALFVDELLPALNLYINRRGFSEHSLSAFEEALQISRANPFLHPAKRSGAAFWVSYNLEALGRYEAGELLARESMRNEADPPRKYYGAGGFSRSLLGGHLAGQGRYAEAEPWALQGYELLLQSAGPTDVNTWNAWTRVVAVYAGWGRSEQLIPLLQRVMDMNPPPNVLDVWAWNVLVHPNLATPLYEQAFEALRRADALAPGDVHITKTLGIAEYRLGRFESALHCMRQADVLRRAQFPDGIPEDVAFIAMSLHALGRSAEARQAYDRMCALLADDRPDHPVAARFRSEVEQRLGLADAR